MLIDMLGAEGKFKSMSGEDYRIRIWFDKNKDASIADELQKYKKNYLI